jgi:hypothetical protein
MLDPTRGGALARIVKGPRVIRLDLNVHDSTKCTVGRWVTVDREPTPSNARGFGKLAIWWAEQLSEYSAGDTPWKWLESLDREGDVNRCRTRADADRHEPGFGGPGRGRKVKSPPGRLAVLGFAPRADATHAIPPGMEKLVAANIASNTRRKAMAASN